MERCPAADRDRGKHWRGHVSLAWTCTQTIADSSMDAGRGTDTRTRVPTRKTPRMRAHGYGHSQAAEQTRVSGYWTSSRSRTPRMDGFRHGSDMHRKAVCLLKNACGCQTGSSSSNAPHPECRDTSVKGLKDAHMDNRKKGMWTRTMKLVWTRRHATVDQLALKSGCSPAQTTRVQLLTRLLIGGVWVSGDEKVVGFFSNPKTFSDAVWGPFMC